MTIPQHCCWPVGASTLRGYGSYYAAGVNSTRATQARGSPPVHTCTIKTLPLKKKKKNLLFASLSKKKKEKSDWMMKNTRH